MGMLWNMDDAIKLLLEEIVDSKKRDFRQDDAWSKRDKIEN